MKLSVRTNIFLIFFLITGILSFALISSSFYFNVKTANTTTEKTFKIIVGNIEQKQLAIKRNIEQIIIANTEYADLRKTISFKENKTILDKFTYLMQIKPSIAAIYYTNSNKAFYEVINAINLKKTTYIPKKTRWILKIYKNNIIQYMYYDTYLKAISKHQENLNYSIESRPWYQAAIRSNHIIHTNIYPFKNREERGLTYAYKFDNNNSVFAIDYSLKELKKALQLQKFLKESEIFLFNQNGTIVISSENKEKFIDPIFQQIIQNKEEKKVIKYSYNNQDYYAIYKHLNKDLLVGIRLNIDVLLQPYKQNLFYSLSIAFLILLLSIPLILYATEVIIKPIYELIKENQNIKKRKFNSIKIIQSNILEFTELSESLVTMAQSIHNYQKQQKRLLDSIIKLIAEAVDAKSSYTAGHCKRVPEIANLLLQSADKSDIGTLKNFKISNDSQRDAFSMAAWLHDCGKVTTPEYVVDKATKLETIYNRIHEIRTRFEVLWRDTHIEYLQNCLEGKDKQDSLLQMNKKQKKLQDDFAFIAECNIGKEYISQNEIKRIKEIAKQKWLHNFDKRLGLSQEEFKRYEDSNYNIGEYEDLLADNKEHIIKREHFDYDLYNKEGFKEDVPEYLYNYGEIYNLCISKGTLTKEERYKINEHVIMSIKMLEQIPFPIELANVPKYAGEHHETLDGQGYPKKLTEKELSIPSRIMAIADIFEALTAADRPYKKAKKLSEALDIMHSMVKERHIDKDLFTLFITEKIYMDYANKYLKKEQIDTVDEKKYLSAKK